MAHAPIIVDFSELKSHSSGHKMNLLLGNGFSVSLHQNFKYDSLYELSGAKADKRIRSLFDKFDTTNFEAVMRKLEDAQWVAMHYGLSGSTEHPEIRKDLDRLKDFLIESVGKTHPADTYKIDDASKQSCQKFLSGFHDIFTLNYDLLLYWTLLSGDRRIDGFGSVMPYDPAASYLVLSQPRGIFPWVFNMHGALHLYTVDGEVRKRRWQPYQAPLLSIILEAIRNSEYPLYVSEGTASQKMRQIRQNAYLSMCYSEFSKSVGMLCAYGVSFEESDDHIIEAIARNFGVTTLAVGVYGDFDSSDNLALRSRIARLQRRRNEHAVKVEKSTSESKEDYGHPQRLEILFYDSESAKVWNGAENQAIEIDFDDLL